MWDVMLPIHHEQIPRSRAVKFVFMPLSAGIFLCYFDELSFSSPYRHMIYLKIIGPRRKVTPNSVVHSIVTGKDG